jgi:hypothetical protein
VVVRARKVDTKSETSFVSLVTLSCQWLWWVCRLRMASDAGGVLVLHPCCSADKESEHDQSALLPAAEPPNVRGTSCPRGFCRQGDSNVTVETAALV